MLNTFSGRRPSQNEVELRGFIDLLRARSVTRYLEIGARHGDTFHEIMTALPAGSCGIAVDLPGGLWGTLKSRQALERAVADLRSRGYRANCVFGDSQQRSMREFLGSGAMGMPLQFDAILIDGDHTLAGVTRDWELYRDLAPLIAFHDIVGTGQAEKVGGRPVEVPVLWDHLKRDHEHHEFVDVGSQMGIGALWK